MNWVITTSYVGYLLAILLCWNLGGIFRVPMLLNLAFNVVLNLRLFAGWDARVIFAIHGFLFFLWTLALTQSVDKPLLTLVVGLDLAVVFGRLLPDIQVAGTGPNFWNAVSTNIIEIWMISVLGVSGSVLVRSTLVARLKGKRMDVLTNPKKRFLIPIFFWSALIALPPWFGSQVPPWLMTHRFAIAAEVLVWGWVVFELPFALMYYRLLRQAS